MEITTKYNVGDDVWFYDATNDIVKSGKICSIYFDTKIDVYGWHIPYKFYGIIDWWEEMTEDELFHSEEECKEFYGV